MIKKAALGLGAVGTLALLAAFTFQGPIGAWLFQRAVANQLGAAMTTDLEDGLHLGLCGTGSPLPNVNRAGPCH